MPACKKFRHAPLENEDELDIIFDMSTCTNEFARVPGVDDVVQPIAIDVDDSPTPTPTSDRRPKKRVAEGSPAKKPIKNFRDKQFKRLVDVFVEKASSSKAATNSPANDVVMNEISEMLDSVIQAGADEGSDEHFYATQLLIKKEYRDVFATLKKPEVKLAWLRRTWEKRKKR
ncbi:hypothetical protein BS78_01G202400 [Paspalum vaginatum]|nr:hypothetical protein BS78_01G202400 [Paspalum vaginatum]